MSTERRDIGDPMAEPLVWTLSAPDSRGARSTFHDGGEGTVRVVEQSAYLALQKALGERDRLAEMNSETVQRTVGKNLQLREALAWLIGGVEGIEKASSGRFGLDLTLPRAALDPLDRGAEQSPRLHDPPLPREGT